MDELQQPSGEDRQQESLADARLTPVEQFASMARTLAKATVVVGAAGAGLLVVGSIFMPCMGATRSAKLKFQARQLEIEQAAAQAQADVDNQI